MMRVLILQDYLRGGGTEKHTVLLANGFRELGHVVRVVTFRPGGVRAGELKTEHVALQRFDFRLNAYAPGLVRVVKAFSPDVIVCMGREANARGYVLKKALPQVHLMATVRTARRLTRAYRRSIEASDSVVVNSEWARQRLLNADVRVAKVHVIPNLLGNALQDLVVLGESERVALRQRMGVREGQLVLLYHAGFRKRKGQQAFLQMVGRCRAGAQRSQEGADWVLWFLGDGPYLKRCVKLARRLGLDKQVVFWGYQKDISPYLQAADIGVLCSLTESQPNCLIEAQAYGVPVVAWDVAGEGETFIDGESGVLVEPWDDVAFCQGLELLRATSAGARGREFVLERFDTRRNLERYSQLWLR